MDAKLNKFQNPAFISLTLVMLALAGLVIINYQSHKKPNKNLFFGNDIGSFCINATCVKNDNGWTVTIGEKNYPADTEKAELMAKQMRQVDLSNVVSVNKDKFVDFGFADNTLTVKANNNSLEMGNMASDYESTYVKSGDVVYKIPFVWNGSVYSDANYWKNKTITNLPSYQVKKITVVKKDKETVTEPKDGKWPDEKFMEKAAHLTAKNVMEGPGSGNKELATVKIEIDQSSETIFVVGVWDKSRKESIYWVRDMKGNYYQISKEDSDLLTR